MTDDKTSNIIIDHLRAIRDDITKLSDKIEGLTQLQGLPQNYKGFPKTASVFKFSVHRFHPGCYSYHCVG
jgi:hypothetical protein